MLIQDAPLAAESDLNKFTEFKYPHLKISADFMVDIIPYKFIPYLGPFHGFNWESVTHVIPVEQLKIGKTYHLPSFNEKKQKSNKKSDSNNEKKNYIDDKNNNKNRKGNNEFGVKIDDPPVQSSHQESIEKFKKECVWWGWSILDPSQLGTILTCFKLI